MNKQGRSRTAPRTTVAPGTGNPDDCSDTAWVQQFITKNKAQWGQLGGRSVVPGTQIDPRKWPQVFHVFDNALISGSTDPRDHQMAGRLLYVVCPTRFFTPITAKEFGNVEGGDGSSYPPCPRAHCPFYGKNKKVVVDSWAPPRKVCELSQMAYVVPSTWRCQGCKSAAPLPT